MSESRVSTKFVAPKQGRARNPPAKSKARRDLEKRLREKERQLLDFNRLHQRIIDMAGDGVIATDRDERVIRLNLAARQMLGLEGQKARGRNLHDLFHTEGECNDSCKIIDVLRSVDNEVHSIAISVNGTDRILELSCRNLDGRDSGRVMVIRDITQRDILTRMKDDFISITSHELRTPLTAIRGSLGLVANDVLGPIPQEARDVLDIALENADRLVRLVNDFLDMHRMETGHMELDCADHAVDDLFAEVIRTMSPVAGSACITIVAAPTDLIVTVDSVRLVQVLVNLVQNAVKFSPSGSQIELTARSQGDDVVVSVKDHGRGIPRDHLDHVFEPFHQVDASDSKDRIGSGLGLAICRRIIDQHGGRIWVEQPRGGGSIFCFTLPGQRKRS
jgi:PAS domain S-box-containing protein